MNHGEKLIDASMLKELFDYVDKAIDRQFFESKWIDENGGLTTADVGYGVEWWTYCMKPELMRVFCEERRSEWLIERS